MLAVLVFTPALPLFHGWGLPCCPGALLGRTLRGPTHTPGTFQTHRDQPWGEKRRERRNWGGLSASQRCCSLPVLLTSLPAPILQVMLLGDSGVGKTCFLLQFKDGAFLSGTFIATVGIDFRVRPPQLPAPRPSPPAPWPGQCAGQGEWEIPASVPPVISQPAAGSCWNPSTPPWESSNRQKSPLVLLPLTFKLAKSLGLAHPSCVHGLGVCAGQPVHSTMQAKAHSWGGQTQVAVISCLERAEIGC